LVCEFSCFSVPQSLRGFWHWLLLWFLWVPLQLRGHWFGGRVYTLFPPSFLPLRKKKETLSATLFLLFWTALDLVCFLHFESFILRLFFFFFSWTQVYPLLWLLLLASTYSSVMMLY
jgi:hypothetical protein